MFTPQQIEQISFSRATFGGYDMQAVDEFLEPLTEDYITLYKETPCSRARCGCWSASWRNIAPTRPA